jgi:hypothetical protein
MLVHILLFLYSLLGIPDSWAVMAECQRSLDDSKTIWAPQHGWSAGLQKCMEREGYRVGRDASGPPFVPVNVFRAMFDRAIWELSF